MNITANIKLDKYKNGLYLFSITIGEDTIICKPVTEKQAKVLKEIFG